MSEQEQSAGDAGAQEGARPRAVIYRKGAARPERRIELAQGVALIGRPLDARQMNMLIAQVNADLDAAVAGSETVHPWGFEAGEIEALAAGDERLWRLTRIWMRAVLLARAFTERIEGACDEEGGAIDVFDFDFYRWLMMDAEQEARFTIHAEAAQRLIEAETVEEKNGCGAGPNGHGRAGPIIAKAAAPTIHPAPEDIR